MQNIRLSRIFKFEAAHALMGYDGACRHIHGHSYKLVVTVIGKPLQDAQHPKNGMVMDFGDLKKVVQEHVINEFDHALLLNDDAPAQLIESLLQNKENLVLLPYQPSCENMLLDIQERLRQHLPTNVHLHSLQLSETENSFAEWFASDNVSASPTTAQKDLAACALQEAFIN